MSEEISSEMHKLEIASANVSHLGSNNLIDNAHLPLNLNPFYEGETESNEVKIKDGQPKLNTKITQHNQHGCRRCRLRRRSESVADAYKSATVALTKDSSDNACWTHSPLGVQRQSLKQRRNILRPPVLRKLQNLHKLLQTLPTEDIDRTPATAVVKTLTSPINIAVSQSSSRGICDFRDLIDECQNLLELENDVKGRFGLVSPDQRFSKNFTTMQTSMPARSLFSNKERQNFGQTERNTGTNARSTASTSCSQQAGNSVAAVPNGTGSGDDVTIDELASYFDTFVHIPKKMSTMAEMMYI